MVLDLKYQGQTFRIALLQLLHVLDFHFEGKNYKIVVFCYCSKPPDHRSVNFFCKYASEVKPNFSKIMLVLDLHFQGQVFGNSWFCCNFKSLRPSTINVGVCVHIDKRLMQSNFNEITSILYRFVYALYNLTIRALGALCHCQLFWPSC